MQDEAVTSPRLLLAAGTAAAAVISAAPAVSHTGVAASAPVRAGAAGVSIAAGGLRDGATASAAVSVPAGVASLKGAASGSAVLANRVRLTVVRTSDGATLFTGSLATFHALPVVSGTKLEVRVAKPAGYRGLQAGAVLTWS
jgi:hypothetical protein